MDIGGRRLIDTHISEQAETILAHRYYLKDTEGNPTEDSPELFWRVAKAIAEFAKENDAVEIKGGLMGTEQLSAQELNTLATLPPLQVLQAQLLGLINTPAQQFVGILSSSVRQVVNVVHAYSDSEIEGAKT